MARYDRTFLVPYFRDICSLYYARKKLTRLIDRCNDDARNAPARLCSGVPEPKYEIEEASGSWAIGGGCLLSLIGLIMVPIAILDSMVYINGMSPMYPLAMVIIGIVIVIFTKVNRNDTINQIRAGNEAKRQQYLDDVETAKKAAEPEVARFHEQRDIYLAECSKVESLLTEAYQADIIPNSYRDEYAAVYFYDWFHNSQSDDLEMALDIYTRSHDWEKLDQIIRDESETLIRDRIEIAMEHMEMEQSEQYHVQLIDRLGQMQIGEEEQNAYQKMIYANAAVDAYFAEAEYLKQ